MRFRIAIAAVALALALAAPATAAPSGFECIAHRGVHQPFSRQGLDDQTCTAARLLPSGHDFVENTIPSIRAAFADGATLVELDVQVSADGVPVVFHDWTLDCRTDGHGEVRRHGAAELRALDVGYGYTRDGGRTFPFRGRGLRMPTLAEVLRAVPDGRLILHVKSTTPGELARIAAAMANGEARLTLLLGTPELVAKMRALSPRATIVPSTRRLIKLCLAASLGGAAPPACRGIPMAIPTNRLPPGVAAAALVGRLHDAGDRVFISEVDSLDELARARALPIDGIETDRIEIVGPACAR